jgi:hypothetical protein
VVQWHGHDPGWPQPGRAELSESDFDEAACRRKTEARGWPGANESEWRVLGGAMILGVRRLISWRDLPLTERLRGRG